MGNLFIEEDGFVEEQIEYWEKKAQEDREVDQAAYGKDLDVLFKLRHEKGNVGQKKEFDWHLLIDIAEVGVQITSIVAGLMTAELAYTNDSELNPCNNKVWNLMKTFNAIGKPKV